MVGRGAGRRTFLSNLVALYGVHAATYVLPLLTTPFLARMLGPAALGLLVFAQAFGGLLGMLVQYGFDFSANREVARVRDDPARLADVLADVLSARLLLAVLAACLALIASAFVPMLHAHPALLWASVFWALAQASNMMWYFVGMERAAVASTLDVATKALATVGIFALVRGPADAWWVPVLNGGAALLSSALALRIAHRDVPMLRPSPGRAFAALKSGWSMFLFSAATSISATGSAFLLGLFVEPRLLGYYNGADRIARAFQGVLQPLNRALYPRFNRAAHSSLAEVRALLPTGLRLLGGIGLLLCLMVALGAPLWVRVLLGPEFAPAVPILRVLALLPLVVSINLVLGILWLLPLGLDRAFNTVVIGGTLLNALLIVLLVPTHGLLGMASAVVLGESAVFVGLLVVCRPTLRGRPEKEVERASVTP
ncbi:flippase [Deinococcus metallilatus]|uniref:Flippase n=1 Tax=Deinococcus metallilatus TaxID=1211322 RepID=A0AAJ5F105_9DEIO|nr:oligosaccharide flippase family protein [Deinococcus metallilatus]MBB5296820.1 PST family polysaccharide transporter [Deinococcus metallilatus]QBY09559.1 flippase [Deinococcus metallilatus]RXJ09163.1 flippase [Deinococcus metallilatus]TLK22793.1 flippase [Deinococcus metallilatus]GMA13852.1 O-antigen transporter [Deinococcus metallilatus]